MGAQRALIDSAGNEAKVTSTGSRLQVRADFESVADLDTLEATLTNLEKALASVATDKLRVSVIDNVLADDAATETTLAKIANALASIATDKLRVDLVTLPLPVSDNGGSLTVDGTVTAQQSDSASLKVAAFGLDGATQRQIKVNANGELVVALS